MHHRISRALLRQVASGVPSRALRIGIAVLLLASVGGTIAVLRHGADVADDALAAVSDVESGVQELNAIAWEARAAGAVTPESQLRLLRVGHAILPQVTGIEDTTWSGAPVESAEIEAFRRQTDIYQSAMTEELVALTSGHVRRAHVIERGRTQSAFAAITANVSRIKARFRQQAQHRRRLADLWSLVLLGIGVSGVAVLYASSRRARQREVLAAARADVVAQSEVRFRSLVQNASDALLVVAPDGRIRTATGAVEATIGREPDAIEGMPLTELVHEDDASRVVSVLSSRADAGIPIAGEWRVAGSDGTWRTLDVTGADLRDDGIVDAVVLTLRDISERKRFEEQLRHRAFHDPLTQLANRALFYDRVEHALSREARDGQLVAVLFVDLDDLKALNDRYGHAIGDEIIVGVAGRLRGCLRSADTAARLGGDEFGVLLEGIGGPGEPVQAAERVLAAVREPIVVQGVPYRVTLSVGIAIGSGGDSADDLLRAADVAMYAAKTAGKHRYELFDGDLETSVLRTARGRSIDEAPDRITWFVRSEEQRAEIQSVLARPESLTVALQPILDIRSGRVAGYEALTRFPGADRRPPNAWFAQAHRSGLGPQLEALAVVRALERPGRPPGCYLSINASPSALASNELLAVLPDRLDGLVLEVTENEIVGGGDDFLEAVRSLRRRGALLAVDDAGSGYAGLRQLVRLHPDVIKLDRSLVSGVHADPTKCALIQSFVRFAASIGASVCAEGVERIEELRALAEMDVTFAQGYVVGRPSPEWAQPGPETVAVCRQSFEEALGDGGGSLALETSERRLARLGLVLGEARDATVLAEEMAMIAAELGADDVQVSRILPGRESLLTLCAHRSPSGSVFRIADYPVTRRVIEAGGLAQVLASDPQADEMELAFLRSVGQSALLMVPVVLRGVPIGLLEATRAESRPWSRLEMGRARIVATQLVGLVDGGADLAPAEAARAA